jgi:NAD(P)-dependent dehydrogenase (short-subunit alcohol dehydrogenase family)
MIIDLSSKRAVVTGSTAGIGFAIAFGLAASGAAVVINGRGASSVAAAQKRLTERVPGARVDAIAADLATAEGVADFLARAGDADILVNSLGIFEPKPFEMITDGDWYRFFDTNVMSGIRLSRHYLPKMVQRGWGRVVFISSESALNIPVEMIHYGMTKTAQLAIARGLAESVAGSGVTVNSVLPGPTRSEGVGDFFAKMAKEQGVSQAEMETQFIAQHRPTSLLRRLATPEEVAIWSFMFARRKHPPLPARPCASTAVWCARSGSETQYRWLMGSSSAGNSVITRHPLSVTTTSSSMRAAE